MLIGEVYAEGRRRVSELVADLTAAQQAMRVPTCPEWTVADVLAHLAGVSGDILAGNIAGVGTDDWTEAQVAARRGRTAAELVAEWSEQGPRVEELAVHFPERIAKQWVMDLTSHEHDLRCALRRPGARDAEGVAIAADFLVGYGLDGAVTAAGLPALEVCGDDRAWLVGEGEPVGALKASSFELVRAFSGRRSAAQVRGLAWPVAPDAYLPVLAFGPFRLSEVDIDE
jgi:uncharacterized protein (TIGR03083 family)